MAKKKLYRKHVSKETANVLAEKIDILKEILPGAFAEGKIDWDKLRGLLDEAVDDRPERFSFTWAGKRDAIRLLQSPSRATLVPVEKESVTFDTTQHVFIEGDNLEVLKLLYKPYWRVIDPDKEQSFYISLDEKITLTALRPLELTRDDLFICRDTALNDEAAANLALQCRLKTI